MKQTLPALRYPIALCVAALTACGDATESGTTAAMAGNDAFCGPALEAVAAYQAQAGATPVVPGPEERYGGTAVVGVIGDLSDGMNALVSADHAANQHQIFVNLMTLVQVDENLDPVPYLAESWEVAEDASSVTFKLRDDVRWHDGEITDAEDVVFTFDRVTTPETGFPNAAFWDGYTGVEMLDARTVRFTMEPHADFMDPWRSVAIMPEHLLGDVPPAELKQHPYGTQCPVGNGPFVFGAHRPQESWTFTANPEFPADLGGRPYVDRYVLRIVPEPTTLLTELLTENIDVYMSPPADQAAQIVAEPGIDFLAYDFRDYVYVAWNSRRPALADSDVRRALTLGTNRAEIVEALLAGYGQVANTSVPPFHWAYDPSLEGVDAYDPNEAMRLLEAAGWTDRDGDGIRENAAGVPLELEVKFNDGNQIRQDIAEIMQAQLSRIGVAVQPTVVEWTTLIEQITSEERNFDGVVIGWVTELKVDDTDLFSGERLDGPYAFSGTQNARLDQLLDTLQTIVDRDEALPLWREYQRVLNEVHPYTFLYYSDRLAGVNERVRNVEMDVRGEWLNIDDWWIEPAERRQR
ncbi:MAG TPA: ABC transporter substrate-binding protein [Longimicrobiales bacterium]|nr:ABC transporter substrate-binding protein [Longimicrobiales bacterium]